MMMSAETARVGIEAEVEVAEVLEVGAEEEGVVGDQGRSINLKQAYMI